MGLFSRKRSYDRTRLLGQATRAAQRRRHKKAIALYRQILAVNPNDTSDPPQDRAAARRARSSSTMPGSAIAELPSR